MRNKGFGRGGRSFFGSSRSPRSTGRSFGARNQGGQGRYRSRGATLNPMMFVKRAEVVEAEVFVPKFKFADFPVVEQLKKNIEKRGYGAPTPIQDGAIMPLIEGRDLVGVANTGTGKTAAFLIPLINKVAKDRKEKVLIVAPTRELAVQIQKELDLFAEGIGMISVLCIGGAPMGRQVSNLRRNPGFVIGTPGRLKDLNKRRVLRLGEYTNVVLDEVDRMLDMGFIHDVTEIISQLPTKRQSLFFSATMPDKTRQVMESFLVNPVSIKISSSPTSRNVDQDIVRTAGKDKVEILHDLLIKEEFKKVLVFGRTKWGVNKLEAALLKRGFKVSAIHGNKSQGQRQRALQELRDNRVQVLLATDVAARGLDIEGVSHVINFDIPESYDDYIHRIGRTGRANKSGVALTFVD